jgi:hypothetical protein
MFIPLHRVQEQVARHHVQLDAEGQSLGSSYEFSSPQEQAGGSMMASSTETISHLDITLDLQTAW